MAGIVQYSVPGAIPLVSAGRLARNAALTRASVGRYFDSSGVLQEAAVNAARLDYDPATLLLNGLRLEGARTNVIRNPRAEGAVAGAIGAGGAFPTNWTSAGLTGLTRTVVGVGTEDGIPYIDLRVNGTPGSTSGIPFRFESTTQIVAAPGQVWTSNSFVRLVAGSLTGVVSVVNQINERNSGGTLLVSGSLTLIPTDGALRIQARPLTYTLVNGSTARITPVVGVNVTNGVAVDLTLRIGAPQLELGAFASSIILPPASSPAVATRAADSVIVASLDTIKFNAQGGGALVVARTAPGLGGDQVLLQFDNGAEDERIRLVRESDGTLSLQVRPPSPQVDLSPGGLGGYSRFVAALGWEEDNFAIALDGGEPVTDLGGLLPIGISRMVIGADWSGWVEDLRYYSWRLPNA